MASFAREEAARRRAGRRRLEVELLESRAVPAVGRPDLVVTSVLAPASAPRGGDFDVTFTVKNQGTAAALPPPFGWSDTVYLAPEARLDKPRDQLRRSFLHGMPLEPGASYTATGRVFLPSPDRAAAGSYFLLVVAADRDFAGDVDPSNNMRAVPFTITGPGVDLAVGDVRAPASARLGETISLAWTLTNKGGDATQGSLGAQEVFLTDDPTRTPTGSPISSASAGSPDRLAAGESRTLRATITLPARLARTRQYLVVVTDRTQGQPDRDRSNNIVRVPLTLLAADLQVTDLSLSAAVTRPGDTVTVSWKDVNTGTASAAAFADRVILRNPATGAILVDTRTSPTAGLLSPGASQTRRLAVTLPASAAGASQLQFQVIADGSDVVAEANDAGTAETNNDAAVTRSTTSAAPVTVRADVNDGSAQRSMVKSVTLTFSAAVTLDPGAVRLTRGGTAVGGVDVSTTTANGKTVAVLTFHGNDAVGGSLADGRSALTVVAAKVRGPAGSALAGDFVANFHRLFGDTDGNGRVDDADLDRFIRAIDKRRGQDGYVWYVDFNGDGAIDRTTDYYQFLSHYGRAV